MQHCKVSQAGRCDMRVTQLQADNCVYKAQCASALPGEPKYIVVFQALHHGAEGTACLSQLGKGRCRLTPVQPLPPANVLEELLQALC